MNIFSNQSCIKNSNQLSCNVNNTISLVDLCTFPTHILFLGKCGVFLMVLLKLCTPVCLLSVVSDANWRKRLLEEEKSGNLTPGSSLWCSGRLFCLAGGCVINSPSSQLWGYYTHLPLAVNGRYLCMWDANVGSMNANFKISQKLIGRKLNNAVIGILGVRNLWKKGWVRVEKKRAGEIWS